ncbi:hypothetical protein Mapa_006540 [Marchantia paleacea]|nr:hypothetical protein Mapa_006540 [Marchantia paleacea]
MSVYDIQYIQGVMNYLTLCNEVAYDVPKPRTSKNPELFAPDYEIPRHQITIPGTQCLRLSGGPPSFKLLEISLLNVSVNSFICSASSAFFWAPFSASSSIAFDDRTANLWKFWLLARRSTRSSFTTYCMTRAMKLAPRPAMAMDGYLKRPTMKRHQKQENLHTSMSKHQPFPSSL